MPLCESFVNDFQLAFAACAGQSSYGDLTQKKPADTAHGTCDQCQHCIPRSAVVEDAAGAKRTRAAMLLIELRHDAQCEAARAARTVIESAMRELLHHLLQFAKFALQFGVFFVSSLQLIDELLVQSLDRRQGHAIGVHGGDVFVIGTRGERRVEILRHRTDVFARGILSEVPARDRKRGHFLQHVAAVDWFEVFLRVAVAGEND
jgi:hypothetical protein